MAKQANTPVVSDEIVSLKDGAYKQASANDRVVSVAKYVMDKVKGFPDTLPDEAKAELTEGYRLRFGENNPPVTYAIVDDHYIPLADGQEAKEKAIISVHFVFSFSQQQYGRLKNDNPYLYDIVKPIREKCITYCSNRVNDLKRQARALLKTDTKGNRTATLDFVERVPKVLDDLDAKCKVAKERGDTSADLEKYRKAVVAFYAVWNAKK